MVTIMGIFRQLFAGGHSVPSMTNTELEVRLEAEGTVTGAGNRNRGHKVSTGEGGVGAGSSCGGREPGEVRPPLIVVDVREAEEMTGPIIAGAVNIPLSRLPDRLDQLDAESDIVLVCRSGNRSYLGAMQLMGHGYRRVWNLEGGMLAWTGPVTRVTPP